MFNTYPWYPICTPRTLSPPPAWCPIMSWYPWRTLRSLISLSSSCSQTLKLCWYYRKHIHSVAYPPNFTHVKSMGRGPKLLTRFKNRPFAPRYLHCFESLPGYISNIPHFYCLFAFMLLALRDRWLHVHSSLAFFYPILPDTYTLPQKKRNFSYSISPGDPGSGSVTQGHEHYQKWF